MRADGASAQLDAAQPAPRSGRRGQPWSELADPMLISAVALGWGLAVVLHSAPTGYAALLDTWDGRNFLAIAADGYPTDPARDANGVITDPRWAFFPVFPFLLRAAGVLTGLPIEVLVPALNGLAALLALTVLYTRHATLRLERHGYCGGRAGRDEHGDARLDAGRTRTRWGSWAWSSPSHCWPLDAMHGSLSILTVLAVTRPVMAPLAVVVALDSAYIWRRSTTRTRAVALATTIWAGMTVLIWPVVAWVATGNPLTYWDTEKAYEHPDKPRSWLVWALQSGLGGVLAIVLVVALLVWVAIRALPTDSPFAWRAWLVAYPVYLGAATFISGSLVRYLLVALSRRSAAGGTRPVTLGAGHRWPPVALWGSPYSRPGLSSSSSLLRV